MIRVPFKYRLSGKAFMEKLSFSRKSLECNEPPEGNEIREDGND